jgi:outer membrane usher protein FimD/PapC
MRLLAPGNRSPNRHNSAPLAVEAQASPQTSVGIAGRAQTISRVRSCPLPNRTTSQTLNLSKDRQSAHGDRNSVNLQDRVDNRRTVNWSSENSQARGHNRRTENWNSGSFHYLQTRSPAWGLQGPRWAARKAALRRRLHCWFAYSWYP